MQAPVVVPVDPAGRDPLDVVDGAQRAGPEWRAVPDRLVLEQPDRGLGQGIDAPIVVNP